MKNKQIVCSVEEEQLEAAMNECAQNLGQKVLREWEEQKTSVPEELDRCCRELMKRFFDRQRRLHRRRAVGIATVVALLFLSTCTALMASVEAIRTPVLRLLACDKGEYSTIDLNSGTDKPFKPEETVPKERLENPLEGMIPEDYSLIHCEKMESDTFICFYENEKGQKINFYVSPATGSRNVDTENAQTTKVRIFGHEGMLIVKDRCHILWLDGEAGVFYDLVTYGMDPEAGMELAEKIAQCPDWKNIVYGDIEHQ